MEDSMKLRKLAAAACGALIVAAYSAPALATCNECGTVVDVKTITEKGESSGGGAVVGGILGGVIGHQIGSGRGNTVATVAGAAGGAYAGNQVEKNRNTKTSYRVYVKTEDGRTRYFTYPEQTAYRIGDKVKVVDGKLLQQ
jgi:outer membrane lipoprotein SlyB